MAFLMTNWATWQWSSTCLMKSSRAAQPRMLPALSLQSHCFMVARNLMRIIINNEISLIIIFRYCYNNIDIFDVSQKYQYFFKKITIFLTRIIIFLIIFFKKILLIFGKKYHYFCAKISLNISLFLGQNII